MDSDTRDLLAGARALVARIGDGTRPVPFSVMADVAALAAAGLALREAWQAYRDQGRDWYPDEYTEQAAWRAWLQAVAAYDTALAAALGRGTGDANGERAGASSLYAYNDEEDAEHAARRDG